ncbi:MAG: type II toxin-antitoxin system HicA family toxin [Patescibacteria group bacterium]
MGRIPVKPPREVIRAFEKAGYRIVRQTGGHIRLRHPFDTNKRPLTIPNHTVVKPGLLARAIKDAGLSLDEFIALLNS